jgi:CelD/BcsL family acetyltransferase involved in cellulose biosynthesis
LLQPEHATDYSVRAVSSSQELEALREDWGELARAIEGAAFYHQWAWHRAMRDHLAGGQIVYHCVRRGDLLVAVVPLVGQGIRGPLRSRVLQAPWHTDLVLGDILIRDDHVGERTLERLLTGLRTSLGGRWDLATWRRVRPASCLIRAVADIPYLVSTSDAGGCYFCDCRTPQSLGSLSKKLLRNVDRLGRRAEREHGHIAVETFSRPEQMAVGLEHFFRIESSGWKGERGTALALRDHSMAFYRSVMTAFSVFGNARVDLLRIGDRPAAAQVALRTGRVWYVLKIGFDPSLATVGPGQILLKRFLEEMCQDDLVAEVNLGTDPAWAERWHMQWEPVHLVRIYGRTARGRLLSLGRRMKEMAKKVRDSGASAPKLRKSE